MRGITYGTIDYANSEINQLNVLDIVLSTSRSDIKALKFEIPMIDEFGVLIFNPASIKNSFFNL